VHNLIRRKLNDAFLQDWTKEEVPAISAPYNASVISDKVNYLQSLAVKLRLKREANGALRLDQPKLSFFLDRETGLPQGYQLYEHRHSNRLIEEFMLLANIAVAKKICGAFPQMAVLRRHPKPKGQVMEKTREMLGKFGEF
jgi:DIS3-like exonuclease 2